MSDKERTEYWKRYTEQGALMYTALRGIYAALISGSLVGSKGQKHKHWTKVVKKRLDEWNAAGRRTLKK